MSHGQNVGYPPKFFQNIQGVLAHGQNIHDQNVLHYSPYGKERERERERVTRIEMSQRLTSPSEETSGAL